MAEKRVNRKQLLKEPDEFFTLTGKTIAWAKKNPRPLLYGVCALFLIAVGVSVYGYIDQRRANAAAELLGMGMFKYEQAQAQQAAGKTDGAKALEAARPDLKKVIDEYGGQPAGRLGLVLLAHYELADNSPEQALKLYKQAQAEMGGDSSMGNIILNGLAAASEMKGDNAAAIEYARQITAGGSPVLKDVALYRLGRLYRQAGDQEKSNQAYGELAAQFPESSYAALAKERAG